MKYFGGVEGGASNSKVVICDETGKIVANTNGPGTNHWIIGISECAKRLANMIDTAKELANLSLSKPLNSLGLSLSGCEQDATNLELEKELQNMFPLLAENYVICSDTIGSLHTVSPIGGLVLISGTGSNALLRNPSGSVHGCGGWGHMIGDEGSGWWIANLAVKIVFNEIDNFSKSPHPIDKVWKIIQEHFSIQNRQDLLDHCYSKFEKHTFASLTKKFAEVAHEDNLCKYLFGESGKYLARHVIALLPKIEKSLIANNPLDIICVGSVWFSWELLKDAFIAELNKIRINYPLRLVKIKQTTALGAVYLAADKVKFILSKNYADNYDMLFEYTQK